MQDKHLAIVVNCSEPIAVLKASADALTFSLKPFLFLSSIVLLFKVVVISVLLFAATVVNAIVSAHLHVVVLTRYFTHSA